MDHEAADAQVGSTLPGPLIPPELASGSLEYHGPLRGRQADQDSILRFLSKPGHPNGEGSRRIFIGSHPRDPQVSTSTSGSSSNGPSRSFLIGIDALWAEERALANHSRPINRVQREVQGEQVRRDPRIGHARNTDPSPSSRSSRKGKERARDSEDSLGTTTDDEPSSSDTSSSSGHDGSSTVEDSPKRHRKWRRSRQNGDTRADSLFAQLRSGDNRKKLSEGQEDRQSARADGCLLSSCVAESPAALSDNNTSAYLSAQAFLAPDGTRAVDKPLLPETIERIREEGPEDTDGLAKEVQQLHHELVRRPSETLVPDTASDTVAIARPKLPQGRSVKSAIWDASRKKAAVPTQKKRVRVMTGPSGDQPKAAPEEVLNRPDPLENPADDLAAGIPTLGQLGRSPSSESAKLLKSLASTKQESLPPGVEKLERMLVRVGWTSRKDLPEDLDELAARRFPIRYTRWEEMAVVWKRSKLELWGSYSDPFRRFMTTKLQRKAVIPLRTGTQMSLYTAADEIISLRCPCVPLGGRHQSGKPGLRNKRHLSHKGTLVFLLRARSPSIAEDWYLGLHIALGKERLSTLEIHSPNLGFRVRLPTDAQAHDTASASVTVSATRQLMSAGLPHSNLVSKEEMLDSCKTLLSARADWAELLMMLEREGIPLALAWRKGSLLDWLLTDWSIDGARRIWDVYVGAIMRQSSSPLHKLEIHPEIHGLNVVTTGHQKFLIEPPGIEGFVSRLRYRNETQLEKLYISTGCGFLLLTKAGRAKAPEFPSSEPKYLELPDGSKFKQHTKALEGHENRRMLHHILKCRGAVRLRDIVEVSLDDSCNHCRQQSALHSSDTASKVAQSLLGKAHDHAIVQVKLTDVRKIRFEVEPPEAAQEWCERLRGLVDYWSKRGMQDAKEQVTLDMHAACQTADDSLADEGPEFQKRERQDSQNIVEQDNPLLARAFNVCVNRGCRHDVLMQGRLYYKKGHRDAPFEDRYFVIAGDHLIQFESVKRNLQKRSVPISYHPRKGSIRIRDTYIITGQACSDYLARSGPSNFDPSSDHSSLSRIYRDGLVSVDDLIDCTFMLWKQKSMGNAASLGKNGKVYVFQARSRLERDQWVQALNVACENVARTSREREIRLSTFKRIG